MHDHECTAVHKDTAPFSSIFVSSVPVSGLFNAHVAAAIAAQRKLPEKIREM